VTRTSADLALIDGKILTMNKSQPSAEAVAIKNSRIVKVGTTDEISHLIGKNTKIVYLDWRTVVPGFIDTHIHVADFGRFLLWMNLTSVGSIAQMLNMLSQRLEKTLEGKWVVGRGWDENRFAEKRLPNRFDLDAVSQNSPVIFYHSCGQVCVVNSKALELAGITKETTVLEGGIIETDSLTGEPTGLLRETATDLVWRKIPEPSVDELAEVAALACEKIIEAGITSIHWMAESSTDVAILKRLVANKKLPLSVYMIVPEHLLSDSGLRNGLEGSAAKIEGVEVFADGFLASKTAALFQPYFGSPSTNGKLLSSSTAMASTASKIVDAGFQFVIHAMGDKAIDAALEAIKKSAKKGRPRIEQAALLNEELIQRVKNLKVTISVQPLVAASEFSVYSAEEHLGKQRARWLYPLMTMMKKGIKVCSGSDCPMEPLNPLLGIHALVNRQYFPEESLTVDEALRMYTINAAYASEEENEKGSIEEGKLADLTVLSDDLSDSATNKINSLVVDMTIIGGKAVYER
jgi:predicted amidohydrolase YtcJ